MAYGTSEASLSGHARDNGFNSSSPQSSSGAADSFKGTPDTRLTSFSPSHISARSAKAPASLSIITKGAAPVKFAMAVAGSKIYERDNGSTTPSGDHHTVNLKDPFISSTAAKVAPKLSPTASTFFPNSSTKIQEPNLPQLSSQTLAPPNSFPQSVNAYPAVSAAPCVQGVPATLLSSQDDGYVHSNLSTEIGLSRCLVVSKQGASVKAAEVQAYVADLIQEGFICQGSRQFHEYAEKVFVRFSNIRASCMVVSNLAMRNKDWDVKSISTREFSMVVEARAGLVTSHEGQLYLSVFAYPAQRTSGSERIQDTVLSLLRPEGDVFALKQQTGVEGSLFSAVIEYCDGETALRVVSKLHGLVVEGLHFCMTLYQPDMTYESQGIADTVHSHSTTNIADVQDAFQRLNMNQSQTPAQSASMTMYNTPVRAQLAPTYPMRSPYSIVPMVYHGIPLSPPYVSDSMNRRVMEGSMPQRPALTIASPFPGSPKSFGSPDSTATSGFSPFARRQHALRVTRSSQSNAAGAHNVVEINRIREGTDVRTTIMLRNIPNKVDQAMLKGIIDESSWGKYDFMYLRIDFANDCNVGYAFINFVDPLDIIDFMKARANQRWNCFKSDKVAEISYATIQGKDCLVQKFRNSSVMLEAEHYRPKLYFTLNGPRPDLAGEEESFPTPDNPSKMKRSCENAEHVGLFTPNAGQHFRDEQRRRRSQFDRGTRFAEYEEYDYDSPLPRGLYISQ
ncbi:RNA recognition motif 2-domain-containing protein [Microdochium bolleyi]|uniref:RNA recognition motif 2-domain-containing protein n=1 Tax=Microdochium bolleyi TaxID=196109 RepID=A0A136JB41_9PEZI|nr:RNA recognition motif 2-domain-containing protein [Microdochium bolleyi]